MNAAAGPAARPRFTYYSIFTVSLYVLGFLIIAGMLWSFWGLRGRDWLVDGRYVELTRARYGAGSVTRFAFDEWRPPRPVGFFLLVDGDGTYLAVGDRPGGCVLTWQSAADRLVDPCRGTAYTWARLRDEPPSDIGLLPVAHDDNILRVDLQPLLGKW